MRQQLNRVSLVVGAMLITVLAAPRVLAFPYQRSFGTTIVRSEQPIPDAMAAVLARSDALLRTSPIAGPAVGTHIFLTGGGWRWHLLSLNEADSFALSRPVVETIVVKRSDPATDRAFNDGHVRSLSGVIAHERTHELIRASYGVMSDWTIPGWKREGYADYIARESSLSDGEAARLVAAGKSSSPLFYYQARRRVAAALAAAHGSVDRLMTAT